MKTGSLTFVRFTGRAIGFFTQILLARILAPENFGLYAIGWTLLRLFAILGHLGFDYGVIKFGAPHYPSDYGRVKSVASVSLLAAFSSGLLLGTIQYAAAPWIARDVFFKPELLPILQGFAAAYPLTTTLRVLAATASITRKTICGASAEDLIQPVFQIALFLLLILLGFKGVQSAIISTILSYLLACFQGAICVHHAVPGIFTPKDFSFQDFRMLASYSLPAVLGASMGAFNLWGDRLLVGLFGTSRDAGLYQSISLVSMFTITLISGIKLSVSPTIASLFSRKDVHGITALARTVTRWALYISLPVLSTLWLNGETVLGMVFGDAFREAEFPFMILILGQVFYILFGIVDQIFLMTGNQRTWIWISGIIFLLTILLDAILIPRFHLIGASLVSSGMLLLLGCISLTLLGYRFRFQLLDGYHFKLLGAAMGSIVLVQAGNAYFDPVEWIQLPVNFILLTVLFFGITWMLCLENRDRTLIQRALTGAKDK